MGLALKWLFNILENRQSVELQQSKYKKPLTNIGSSIVTKFLKPWIGVNKNAPLKLAEQGNQIYQLS